MRWLSTFILLLSIISCKKDDFNSSPDARISVTEDSLRFDTVFTQTGSITQSFMIKNEENRSVILSEVRLMGGDSSAYQININGMAVHSLLQKELAANDSMYVFVTVNMQPGNSQLPFIVRDSIKIAWNGNTKFVQLEAYGQNAHYIRNGHITHDTTWNADIPFVILGGLTIDSNVSLTLSPGVRLFFHADATINVYGQLFASGTSQRRIQLSGDRLDPYYKDLPGSWPGIIFHSSSQGNRICFMEVRQAYRAIDAREGSSILLQQCLIDNAWEAGIFSKNSSLKADNCLVSNCGNNIRLLKGGQYVFTNCTIASYSTDFLFHQFPVAEISDAELTSIPTSTFNLNAQFINCIFWGEEGFVENEIMTNKQGNNFNMLLDHCLFRANSDPENVNFSAVIRNQDPKFDSIDITNRYFDFHIASATDAPGLDKGVSTPLTIDLDGKNRNVGLPDLGCYEKQ